MRSMRLPAASIRRVPIREAGLIGIAPAGLRVRFHLAWADLHVTCGGPRPEKVRILENRMMRLALVLLSIFWALLQGGCTRAAPDPPNILLIVSEDNGPELGSYGDPYVRTPHLDALAGGGVRFSRAYVAQAGCSQSRAAFLTGLYPHQNGQIGLATWRFRLFREDTPNLVTALQQAGYRTGIIGKLHVNPASAFPFDFERIPGANFQRKDLKAYAANAREFIEESAQPFFLSVNYPDAHRPFLDQAGDLPQRPLTGADVKPLAYMGIDFPALRNDTAGYYNSLSRLDSLIGDLLQVLQRSGKADRTLIVYLGDHGADMFRGKRTSYEGGVRVPLIIQWVGSQEPGQVRDELVSTVDLLPTLLAAAGAEAPPGLPGRSLLPLIGGESVEWRNRLFTEFHLHSNHNYYPQRTVRDERYKLIWNLMPDQVNPGYDFTMGRFYSSAELEQALAESPDIVRKAFERMRKPPEFELYDLERDPYEFENLAPDPDHESVLTELKGALLAWRRETADPFLDTENVMRLKAEIDGTFKDGQYERPEGWQYPEYLAPGHSR